MPTESSPRPGASGPEADRTRLRVVGEPDKKTHAGTREPKGIIPTPRPSGRLPGLPALRVWFRLAGLPSEQPVLTSAGRNWNGGRSSLLPHACDSKHGHNAPETHVSCEHAAHDRHDRHPPSLRLHPCRAGTRGRPAPRPIEQNERRQKERGNDKKWQQSAAPRESAPNYEDARWRQTWRGRERGRQGAQNGSSHIDNFLGASV